MRQAERFLFIKNRSKSLGLAWAGLFLSLCILFASAARAAAPTISDGAKLFSSRALNEAKDSIERIYQHTSPHKQVDIETVATLPAGKQADTLAAERFREQNLDGVMMLIVKDPHKLALTVGKGTLERFHDSEAVRSVMLEHFRRSDYDGGLLAGVRLLESRLTSQFGAAGSRTTAAERTVPWTQRAERSSTGSNVWLWLGVLGGGGLLAWFIWRLRKRNTEATNYGPPAGDYGRSYGPMTPAGPGPGYAAPPSGGGGGGWGRSILGGAAGALAGSWLYDRLAHGGNDGNAHAAGSGDDHAPPSDHGDVGSTFGGHGSGADWSDSGGSDIGGGDGGGDW